MLPITRMISKYNHYETNVVKYIIIHYTGNNTDSAKNNAIYFNGGNRNASAHYFVDDVSIYQVVEDNKGAWHIGNSKTAPNNKNSLGVEMCCKNGVVTEKTEENTLQLVKYLMKKYNVSIANVRTHAEVTNYGKTCPNWSSNSWQRWKNFKNKLVSPSTNASVKIGDRVKVKTSASTYANSNKTIPSWVRGSVYTVSKVLDSKVLLKEITSWVNIKDVEKVSTTATSTSSTSYKVQITTSSLNVRVGAGVGYKITGVVRKGEVYTIIQTSNGWGKLKSGLGWINLSYSKRI